MAEKHINMPLLVHPFPIPTYPITAISQLLQPTLPSPNAVRFRTRCHTNPPSPFILSRRLSSSLSSRLLPCFAFTLPYVFIFLFLHTPRHPSSPLLLPTITINRGGLGLNPSSSL
jgi:hypothetical protein